MYKLLYIPLLVFLNSQRLELGMHNITVKYFLENLPFISSL